MKLTDKRILIVGTEPWHGLRTSKYHLAKALAARGNHVVFLDTPAKDGRGMKVERSGEVQVVTYKHWLRGANKLPKALHLWYYRRLLQRVARATGGPFDVIWCFDTSRMQWFPKGMGLPILHLADINILHQGRGLIEGAHLLLTVSEAIREKVLSLVPQAPIHNVGHAIDSAWLAVEQSEKDPAQGPRSVGYAGQMQWDYVEWSSLFSVVAAYPGIAFQFYGPYRDDHPDPAFRAVRALPNAHFHGLVTKTVLMPALHATDMLMLCYRKELPIELTSNSHKLLEYLATGNVVVSSYIPTYHGRHDLLCMAGPTGDYKAVFDQAVKDYALHAAPAQRALRQAFAREHTLEHLIGKVETLLPA